MRGFLLIASLILVIVVMWDLEAPLWAFAGLGILAAIGAYYALAGMAVLTIFLRAGLALVPIGGIAAAIMYWVSGSDLIKPDEVRALIAATAVAAGWGVTFVTGEWRRVAQEQERRSDMIRAVISEVELILKHSQKPDWEQTIENLKTEYEKDRRYRAFIFYGHNYVTLRRLVEQIEVLDWPQIGAVINFFQLLDRLDRIQDRINSEEFHALPWERRQAGMVRYLTLQSQVAQEAERALAALRNGPFLGYLKRLR